MEQPWNSVRIKFNVTREAADRLKELVEADDNALCSLGIQTVQIDDDRIIKLSLASSSSNDKADIIKKNDSLSRLLERSSPSGGSSGALPFVVNSGKSPLESSQLIVQQPHQPTLPSTSQQQNEIIDRQLTYLNPPPNSLSGGGQSLNGGQFSLNSNHIGNLKSPIIGQQPAIGQVIGQPINQQVNQQINQPINQQINQPINQPITQPVNQQQSMGQSPINSRPILNTSPIGNPSLNNKNIQQQQQQFSYVNMQPQPHQINQLNKNLIRPNNLVNTNKITIGQVHQANQMNPLNQMNQLNQMNASNHLAQTMPAQNVQQIQLKYASQPPPQQQQINNPAIGGSNLVSAKQCVRNPNIKMNSNQLPIGATNPANQPMNQQLNQPLNQPMNQQLNQQLNQPLNHQSNSVRPLDHQTGTLTLNSQLNQTAFANSSTATNVASSSPLLVNLLQSNANDHYNSPSANHLSLTNTLASGAPANGSPAGTIKEPPAKKTKTRGKRKPKDKPPDQPEPVAVPLGSSGVSIGLNSGQPIQINKIITSPSAPKTNEMTIKPALTTVNATPSNQIQYQYNSSIITIPNTVTLR